MSDQPKHRCITLSPTMNGGIAGGTLCGMFGSVAAPDQGLRAGKTSRYVLFSSLGSGLALAALLAAVNCGMCVLQHLRGTRDAKKTWFVGSFLAFLPRWTMPTRDTRLAYLNHKRLAAGRCRIRRHAHRRQLLHARRRLAWSCPGRTALVSLLSRRRARENARLSGPNHAATEPPPRHLAMSS